MRLNSSTSRTGTGFQSPGRRLHGATVRPLSFAAFYEWSRMLTTVHDISRFENRCAPITDDALPRVVRFYCRVDGWPLRLHEMVERAAWGVGSSHQVAGIDER